MQTNEKTEPGKTGQRIESLDQLRGYAIFGMILVNFLGQFHDFPDSFRHHPGWMSYADTIAPLFVFVVGMGFRLSWLKRTRDGNLAGARWASLKRYALLVLIGIMVYGPLSYRVAWWDALVDIGVAGILAIPFIDKSAKVRVAAAALYLLLYQCLFSLTGYGVWTVNWSIDGGPLGPLSWGFMLLLGTLAYDWLAQGDEKRVVRRAYAWGLGLMVLGAIFNLEWGETKAGWPFSQAAMSAPYTLYSTGYCFITFLLFYLVCDGLGFRFPNLSVLGRNPLTIYIVQALLLEAHGAIVPRASSVPLALATFCVFYLFCYGVAWRLDRDNIVIKL